MRHPQQLQLQSVVNVGHVFNFRELKSNNVFLAYDLLELRNKEVEKAILHCTGSIVVCPSDHIAESIAAGEFLGGEKTKVNNFLV